MDHIFTVVSAEHVARYLMHPHEPRMACRKGTQIHNLPNVRTEKDAGYILLMRAELGYGLVSWEFRFLFVNLPDIAFALIEE